MQDFVRTYFDCMTALPSFTDPILAFYEHSLPVIPDALLRGAIGVTTIAISGFRYRNGWRLHNGFERWA